MGSDHYLLPISDNVIYFNAVRKFSLSLFLSSLSLLSLSLSCLPACLPAWLLACLPACLYVCMLVCLSVCLPVCLLLLMHGRICVPIQTKLCKVTGEGASCGHGGQRSDVESSPPGPRGVGSQFLKGRSGSGNRGISLFSVSS